MKYIAKNINEDIKTPAQTELENWYAANESSITNAIANGHSGKHIWDNMAFKLWDFPKSSIRGKQLDEQYQICCYCNRLIVGEAQMFEHFEPKEVYKSLIFNYHNLFVCCDGSKNSSNKAKHCDQPGGGKANKDPETFGILSPNTSGIEKQFDFKSDGEIIGLTPLAQSTINELSLNHSKLKEHRKTAIKAYYEKDDFSKDPLLPFLDPSDGQDNKYVLLSYCSALACIRKKVLGDV